MRILLVTDHWYPDSNVPQRRWVWLSNLLIGSGHEFYVLTPQNLSASERRTGCENREYPHVIRTPGRAGGESITRRAFAQGLTAAGSIYGAFIALRSGELPRPDVVIGTVPGIPTTFVAHIIAAITRSPLVLDIRDAWPDLLNYSSAWNAAVGSPSFFERAVRIGPLQAIIFIVEKLMTRSIRRADLVMTTSSVLTSQFKERFEGHVKAPRVVTIRNVFPPFVQVPNRVQRIPTDELRVIYAGKVGRAQMLGNSLQAAYLAQRAGVPISLRVIGAGAAMASVTRLARDLEVNAEFFDLMDPESLSEQYRWADTALVHLADWEPLEATVPSKTFELINAGIHISGVVSGETAEMLTELEAGDPVPPSDPQALADLWVDLWRNPERLAVASRGRAKIEKERDEEIPRILDREFELLASERRTGSWKG